MQKWEGGGARTEGDRPEGAKKAGAEQEKGWAGRGVLNERKTRASRNFGGGSD